MIEIAEQDGVALVRMADGKVNAMSLDLCQALTARFKDLSAAPAVVVTGTGRIFSAGVDLIRASDGRLLVLEVNSNPAWKGLQSVTELDIADQLAADFVASLAGAQRP